MNAPARPAMFKPVAPPPELSAAIRRVRELEAQVVALTLELNRYKEREKTMGWNQS